MGSVRSGDLYYASNLQYDAMGRTTGQELGGDGITPVVAQSFSYYLWNDPNHQGGRLQQILATSTGLLQRLEYTYDPVGNVQQIQNFDPTTPETSSFLYDGLDRLTYWTLGATTEAYEYSLDEGKIGNLTARVVNPGPTEVRYDYSYGAQLGECPDGALDKAHAAVSVGANNFCYDLNGNQVQRTVGGNTYHLTYNYENQLVTVQNGFGASVATFEYDGDGNRTVANRDGVTTIFVGNYYEHVLDSGQTSKYYYANGQRVAMRVDGTLYFLLTDHLGSTAITVDANGNKVAELRYDPWGQTRYSGGTTPTAFRFTGQRLEEGLTQGEGLYYYGARWYDPVLGRFVRPDAIVPSAADPPTLNRYTYALNNVRHEVAG